MAVLMRYLLLLTECPFVGHNIRYSRVAAARLLLCSVLGVSVLVWAAAGSGSGSRLASVLAAQS